MKLWTIPFVCAVILFSAPRADGSVLPLGEYGMDGHYAGAVLCDDCPGVWMDVTLTDTGPDWGSGSGTFVMIERFTGGSHAGATVMTQGGWSTVAWVKDGDYTGTLELRPLGGDGASATPRYFFCDHGRSLEILKQDRSHISTIKPVTLQRVVPPPEPRFHMNATDNGTVVHARVGDTFILALPAASLAAYRTAWTMKPPAAQCMTIYSISGSGNQGVFTSDFALKAVVPGKVRLEFESAEQPSRSVAYDFEVLP